MMKRTFRSFLFCCFVSIYSRVMRVFRAGSTTNVLELDPLEYTEEEKDADTGHFIFDPQTPKASSFLSFIFSVTLQA